MSVSAQGHAADDVGRAGPIAGHPASHAAPTQHPVELAESSAERPGALDVPALEDMYWWSQHGSDERSGEL